MCGWHQLNFPMGEKFDLDVSEQGERWGLPIHLLDALFAATESGRSTQFEKRGLAAETLEELRQAIDEGYLSTLLCMHTHGT